LINAGRHRLKFILSCASHEAISDAVNDAVRQILRWRIAAANPKVIKSKQCRSRVALHMDLMDEEIEVCVGQLAHALQAKGWRLACAESCTGGWISKCCTDRIGSSEWFDRGFIAYSYPAKTDLLGVTEKRLLEFGAVSREIACDMAGGAAKRSGVEVTLAVTGVAGPGGGTPSKPVGTVWFAWAIKGSQMETDRQQFAGDRDAVRKQTVLHALRGLQERLGQRHAISGQ
jgi:nicotinamide-nucleotide amidase